MVTQIPGPPGPSQETPTQSPSVLTNSPGQRAQPLQCPLWRQDHQGPRGLTRETILYNTAQSNKMSAPVSSERSMIIICVITIFTIITFTTTITITTIHHHHLSNPLSCPTAQTKG